MSATSTFERDKSVELAAVAAAVQLTPPMEINYESNGI
jgi:hypothetical protein